MKLVDGGTIMTPKRMAELVRKAGEIREASWDNARPYGKYQKDWHDACHEAGIPEDWRTLIHMALASGYCELWEWCDEILGPPSE